MEKPSLRIELVCADAVLHVRDDDDDDTFTIGRDLRCDLVIPARTVSREHAEIAWNRRLSCYEIRDLQSTNGTFLNGDRIAGRVALPDTCTLDIAGLTFLLRSGSDAPVRIGASESWRRGS